MTNIWNTSIKYAILQILDSCSNVYQFRTLNVNIHCCLEDANANNKIGSVTTKYNRTVLGYPLSRLRIFILYLATHWVVLNAANPTWITDLKKTIIQLHRFIFWLGHRLYNPPSIALNFVRMRAILSCSIN